MKKEINRIIVIFVAFLFLCLNIVNVSANELNLQHINNYNNIIYVDDDNTNGPWLGTIEHPFRYIQDGINNASDGDEVYVRNGLYNESLFVNQSIEIIGESKTDTIINGFNSNKILNIEGFGYSFIFIINDNDVRISNFNLTFLNYSVLSIAFYNDRCHSLKIFDCNISECFYGVLLNYATNCEIIGNNFSSMDIGITIKNSDKNIIKNNYLLDCNLGVLIVSFSSFNQIISNNISLSGLSVAVVFSQFNIVLNNNIDNEESRLNFGLFVFMGITFAEFNYWGYIGPFPPFPEGEFVFYILYYLSVLGILPITLFKLLFLLIFPWKITDGSWLENLPLQNMF